MNTYRIAISGDMLRPDGTPAYPMVDLSPLTDNPKIEVAYLPRNKIIPATDMEGYDALILLGSGFGRESFPSDGRLSIVARFGVGYDNVDVKACSDNDVALVITPDGVRRPVAVVIITFMLALTAKLMAKDRLTREGPVGWAQKSDYMGVGLVGKTLGSVGIGNIGAELFRLAKPFDMNFMTHDPYADPAVAESLGVRMVELEELFRASDILAVNCPLYDKTHHLVNADRLAMMKPTAYLINTARGPVVDQDALTKVLQEGRIAGAGLDVLRDEPPDPEDPILKLDNVVFSPHALCWTDQCFAGIGAADVKAVLNVMQGLVPVGIVNQEIRDNAAWRSKLDEHRKKFASG